MRTLLEEQKAIEERTKINTYLDNYYLFAEACRKRQPDLSSMELAILHHGYVSRGQHNG